MGTLAIPRSPEQMTPDWLTAALQEGGVLQAGRVTSVRPETIGGGSGFLGQLARLHVGYDGGQSGPATMVAKVPSLDPGARQVCAMLQFYEREISFYREIASDVRLRTPRLYYSAMDVPSDDYLMLLEDITDLTCADEVAGCVVQRAELAVRTIAQLHAAWWEHPKLEAMTWMPLINAPVQQTAAIAYGQAYPAFMQTFGDRLSPRMSAVVEKMQTRVVALLDALVPSPRTIVHGDYRLDNIFFGEGDAIGVIDWQISTRGRGAFDMAYFMASCIDPALRKAEEMRLLRLWYDIIGERAGKSYSWDDAVTDYRRAVLFCNVYTVVGVGSLDATNERGTALFERWMERRFAAIEDLDAGELMPA